jgi:polyisoprenyl-teichoic acid--peptidoglycan teichoic acid transferase
LAYTSTAMKDEHRPIITRKIRRHTTVTTEEPRDFLHEHRDIKQKRRKKLRHAFFIACVVAVVVFLTWGLIRVIFTPDNPQSPQDYDPITLVPKKPEGFFKKISAVFFGQEPKLAGQRDDRINILLLGIGGPGHDGPFLTDTIIIASIKPSTQQISMTSIPRDLGVKIPKRGWYKINHANAFGEVEQPGQGGELARQVVEETFAIDIPYYVRVDFKAFQELVDIVGGVKITVQKPFTDNEYPAKSEGYQTIEFEKGTQTMDGSRALQFARSRHGNNQEGSDFARAKRQQQVLLALKEKIISFQTLANPFRVKNILDSLDTHMTTNMEFSDIVSFIKVARTFDNPKISNLVLDSSKDGFLDHSVTEEGAYILLPKTGNFKSINTAIANIFSSEKNTPDTTPTQDKPELTPVNVEIKNATWRAGMAARIRQRLRSQGVTISSIGNTENRPLPESGIYNVADNFAPDVLKVLQDQLNISLLEAVPVGEDATSTSDILVILGEDFIE